MGILEVAIASWVARRQPKMTADEFYRLDMSDPLPRVVIAVLLCVAIIGGLQMLQASSADPQIDADRSVVNID